MSDDRIEWLSWSSDAFGRAAREEKPVLLSITATWCRACHEMDRTTYVDARVVSSVQAGFVAVRVDADRRPDINERYNLGGWPTTAFLTPHGDLLGGGTFVAPDQMVGILDRVRDALRGRGDEIERAQARAATTAPESTAPSLSLDQIVELVFASFDEDHGGFGVAPKFPLTAPLHLALELHRTNGDDWSRRVVERTLDAIRDGGLHDVEHGGFFRYATTREWQLPHVEKLLETNALLLRIYAGVGVDARPRRRSRGRRRARNLHHRPARRSCRWLLRQRGRHDGLRRHQRHGERRAACRRRAR